MLRYFEGRWNLRWPVVAVTIWKVRESPKLAWFILRGAWKSIQNVQSNSCWVNSVWTKADWLTNRKKKASVVPAGNSSQLSPFRFLNHSPLSIELPQQKHKVPRQQPLLEDPQLVHPTARAFSFPPLSHIEDLLDPHPGSWDQSIFNCRHSSYFTTVAMAPFPERWNFISLYLTFPGVDTLDSSPKLLELSLTRLCGYKLLHQQCPPPPPPTHTSQGCVDLGVSLQVLLRTLNTYRKVQLEG